MDTLTGNRAVHLLKMFPAEFIELSPEEQGVSVALYRLLARGQPVSRQTLAGAVGLPPEAVKAILERWPGLFTDERERIIGYWGLALPEMKHRFEVNGRTLYTWCAWDSLFIPQILQQTARVTSECPISKDEIRLTVTPERVSEIAPAGVVVSFVKPDHERLRQDVILNFCHYVHFFSSESAAAVWQENHPGHLLLNLDQAYELGRLKNQHQYKDVLL